MKEYLEKQIVAVNKFREIAFRKEPNKALQTLISIFSCLSDEEGQKIILEWAKKITEIEGEEKFRATRLTIRSAIENIIKLLRKEDGYDYLRTRLREECESLKEEISSCEISEEVLRNTRQNEKIAISEENTENYKKERSRMGKVVSWFDRDEKFDLGKANRFSNERAESTVKGAALK